MLRRKVALDSCWLPSLVTMRGANRKVLFKIFSERSEQERTGKRPLWRQNPNPNVACGLACGQARVLNLLVNQTTTILLLGASQ